MPYLFLFKYKKINKIIKHTYPVLEYDISILVNPKESNIFECLFWIIKIDINTRAETTPATFEFWKEPENVSNVKEVNPANIRIAWIKLNTVCKIMKNFNILKIDSLLIGLPILKTNK